MVTSTCVGVRPGDVYAPNGLSLLYDGVLTMNPLMTYRDLFDRKAESYRMRWPGLRIVSPPKRSVGECLTAAALGPGSLWAAQKRW
ncbi:hypothethical protein (plasmid) [Ralstonia solanacearum CMR15]|nr:hypothethical protein [Ralstonia solanacearum CMR15]